MVWFGTRSPLNDPTSATPLEFCWLQFLAWICYFGLHTRLSQRPYFCTPFGVSSATVSGLGSAILACTLGSLNDPTFAPLQSFIGYGFWLGYAILVCTRSSLKDPTFAPLQSYSGYSSLAWICYFGLHMQPSQRTYFCYPSEFCHLQFLALDLGRFLFLACTCNPLHTPPPTHPASRICQQPISMLLAVPVVSGVNLL
jgi:hypothetical protein